MYPNLPPGAHCCPVSALGSQFRRLFNHCDNLCSNCQRSRSCGAGSVENVQGIGSRDQAELLDYFARRRNGLRAHARPARVEIIWLNLGDKALERAAEDSAAE